MQPVRNAVFAFLYLSATVIFGTYIAVILRWFPYETVSRQLMAWNRWVLWIAKHVAKVDWHIQGLENIPAEPTVFLSNHESQGETYFLQLKFHPVASVVKQELLNIPFFGAGLRLMEPIAIDRSSPKASMKQMLADGKKRLEAGRNIVVYPQGTRQSYQPPLKYARGGAAIGVAAGAPIVPIAHNAARYWPSKGYNMQPGTIQVVIGKPIDTTDKNAKEVTHAVQTWTEEQLQRLNAA